MFGLIRTSGIPALRTLRNILQQFPSLGGSAKDRAVILFQTAFAMSGLALSIWVDRTVVGDWDANLKSS
jgi:hypothetical protein